MSHDAISAAPAQARPLALQLRSRLVRFLRPLAHKLSSQLDIRLVQTAIDLVQVIITHRHRSMGLLLTELGGFLLGPQHAPAGAKRISNLIHAPDWKPDDINELLWEQADAQVHSLNQSQELALAVWDGSEFEKPESQASPDWCPVRSAKGRRLRRRRKGFSLPPKGPPILVPGLHWLGLTVLGLAGPPTLAWMTWWSTRGENARHQREVEQELLKRASQAWGQLVVHIWDRGFAGSPWVKAAIDAAVLFVLRWQKGYKLLDNWGEERKAWEIARGKRSQSYRMLRDTRSKELIKVGVVAIPVTLVDPAQPLWLVVARLGQGREPWYLLTNQSVKSEEQAWKVVEMYARRWQIEVVWRYSKSELGFESIRVEKWEARQKLLLLATLAYAFLLSLLDTSCDELREVLLRNWCHRTGRQAKRVEMPMYRLRQALSRLWSLAPPPGLHRPLLNSG